MMKKLIVWLVIGLFLMTSFVSAYDYLYYNANTRYDYSARWNTQYRGGDFGVRYYPYTHSGYVYGNFNQDWWNIGRNYYRSKYSTLQNYRSGYTSSYTNYRSSRCITDYYVDNGRMVPSQYCRYIAY